MFRSHITESAPSFGCCMPRKGGYRTQSLSWFCCQWQLEYTCKQTTLTWRRLLPSTTRDERWTVCADRNYDDDSCPFLVGRELHAQHACQWRWVRGVNKHSVMRVKKAQIRFWTLTPSNISAHPCMHLPFTCWLNFWLPGNFFCVVQMHEIKRPIDNCKTVWPSSILAFGW